MRNIPPFLTHLRTDRRGIPVPWINAWGPENADTMWIQVDRNVGCPAIFMSDDGDPDFTRQNPQRQREAMSRGLCQVCGQFVPWSHRWLIVSTISVSTIELDGRTRRVITEPWLDARCASFALERCPGLIHRRTADDLAVLTIESKADCQLVLSTGYVDGPLRAQSKRLKPAMWCKIALNVPEASSRQDAP